LFIVENGWDSAIDEFKTPIIEVEEQNAKNTVGDLIRVNQTYSTARDCTLEAYFQALRRVVCGALQLDDWNTARKSGKMT